MVARFVHLRVGFRILRVRGDLHPKCGTGRGHARGGRQQLRFEYGGLHGCVRRDDAAAQRGEPDELCNFWRQHYGLTASCGFGSAFDGRDQSRLRGLHQHLGPSGNFGAGQRDISIDPAIPHSRHDDGAHDFDAYRGGKDQSMKRRDQERGAVTIEMTLVGIPLIFILIMTFEISRGMWMYHTLAYAVKEGVRSSLVHGQNCVANPPSLNNNCIRTIADAANVIRNAGVGLDLNSTNLTFISAGTVNATCTLSGCANNFAMWPPAGSNMVGTTIEIDIDTPFRSAMAGFWPGTKPQSFSVTKFAANSTDRINF
jgi:Flp pilus assembly protein TadG